MPRYTVIIHTPQELNHSSYIQTGLFELEQQGLLLVKVQLSLKKNRGTLTVDEKGTISKTTRAQPKTSFYTLIDTASKKRMHFATDLYDFAEHFSEPALQQCDFYFKRNYDERYASALRPIVKAQILPSGLTFRVATTHILKENKFKIGLFLTTILGNIKFDRLLLRRLINAINTSIRHIKKSRENRIIARFETFTPFLGEIIMFQTRCFLHENTADAKQIHLQRYRLIKLLRKHFPENFMGGFIPSKVARENYGDALTNVPTEPEAYLDAMKKARIVVYTRGLANSPAWKMAEYLSQGKVIIAEPLTTELPVPLTDGKEVLYFHNDAELIDNIQRVLADRHLADSLSKNARSYFEDYVHPVKNVKRILELMLNKPLSQS
ncbi:hypothetical protein LS48_11840 [Aequorivita aquimaris]|uniref:Spore protein YkvP/CgeB glycosyl transferase-like domain-containing protein n=1 Tax=Aequorivita aquimaris TaxID=1548749 RepID=A0A137RG08_9FLAO|nr:glycosyltransferase [Aequorivita aquimaris]KXN98428.1 hypothetical protein LS48_11840 [Aequorivita aquimaris]